MNGQRFFGSAQLLLLRLKQTPTYTTVTLLGIKLFVCHKSSLSLGDFRLQNSSSLRRLTDGPDQDVRLSWELR